MSVTAQPDHYDVINNMENPIVTYDSLGNYERTVVDRLDLKTDKSYCKTAMDTLTQRVANDEVILARKAEQSDLLALQNRVTNDEAVLSQKADQSALDTLTTRVEHNERDINDIQSRIESVEGDMGGTASAGDVSKKADKSTVDALEKRVKALEDKENTIIGTVHVNISTSGTLSNQTVCVRNTKDTQKEDGEYKSQKEQNLINGETTFTNLVKSEKWDSNSWRVGFKRVWEVNEDMYSTATFSKTRDTVEYTGLPFAKFKLNNQSGQEFVLYTFVSASLPENHKPSSGLGHRDDDTGEWINSHVQSDSSGGYTFSSSSYYNKEYVVVALTEDGRVYRSQSFSTTFGEVFECTAKSGDLKRV